MPCPVTWVPPFLACAAGGGQGDSDGDETPAASDAATRSTTAGPFKRVMLDWFLGRPD